VPIAKPDGQNVTRGFDKPARSIENPNHSLTTQRKLKTENEKTSKTKFFNKLLVAEKTLEVDFFKGALQRIKARRRESSGSGELASTTTSVT